MKKKIFVGNLSWKATEDSLKPLFESCGKVVSIKIITDHTGRSKGFGFVEMETSEEAQAVIEKLNGKVHLDREMRVSLAQERPAGGGGERREYRGGGQSSGRSVGGFRHREDRGF